MLQTAVKVADNKKCRKKRTSEKYLINMGKVKNSEVAREYSRRLGKKWEVRRDAESEDGGAEGEGMTVAMKEVAEENMQDETCGENEEWV